MARTSRPREHQPSPSTEDSQEELTAEELLIEEDQKVAPELSVVLPTLDEEEGIRTCIEYIKHGIEVLQLPTEIIVSDNSTDRTPEIARELGARVVTPDQEGYGYAYRYAFERTRGNIIAMGDADTTYDFRRLPDLVERLYTADTDLVLGSRLEGEIKSGAMPTLHRYVGNPVLTAFLNVFYGANVSDAHSGFRVFRREILDDLEFQSTGMEFASEMIMVAAENDVGIAEVPIVYYPREGEETLDSFRDGWRHVKFMLKNAPGYLFTAPALVLAGTGLVTMFLSLLGVHLWDVTFGTYTMIMGSLLTIVGYQVGSLAVFSSVAANPIRSPKDPITEWIRETVRLEHGASVGVVLLVLGSVGATGLVAGWIASGYAVLPDLLLTLVSFTAIVLGIQTVFYSFFLSMLAPTEETPTIPPPADAEDSDIDDGAAWQTVPDSSEARAGTSTNDVRTDP